MQPDWAEHAVSLAVIAGLIIGGIATVAPGNGTATFCIFKLIATDITGGCTSSQRITALRDADADLKYFAIPATTDGTGTSGYGNDIYVFAKVGVSAALRGGGFRTAGTAGVFSLYLSATPSHSYFDVSCRACKAL